MQPSSTLHELKTGKRWKKISVEAWLERWSGHRVVGKIWLPLLRAKLGESYRETSAAFIWATIARMYAARRTGMKRELFGYVSGGYARIVEGFAQALNDAGVQLRLGQPVRSVVRTKTLSANAAKLRIERGIGEEEMFDEVVVTTAAPLAAKLCPELSAEEEAQLTGIRHQGIICASLLLKQPLSEFYVTNITDSRVPYTAVIEMSALVDRKLFWRQRAGVFAQVCRVGFLRSSSQGRVGKRAISKWPGGDVSEVPS